MLSLKARKIASRRALEAAAERARLRRESLLRRLCREVRCWSPLLLAPLLPMAGIAWMAPSPTLRTTPVGIWIPKAFRTKYTMSLDPDASMWEVEVKPSGFDGGEAIPQDNMWSPRMRVFREQAIVECTEATVRFMYDPKFRDDMKGLVNVVESGASAQILTEQDYDGSTRAYYGFLRVVDFDNLTMTAPGMGTATFRPTNWDPINNTYEEPVFANVAGS